MNLKKPMGRALRDFEPLQPGEQRLLNACALGEAAILGDAAPKLATDEQRVRATFVRFLLLGGDEQAPVHEAGVYLQGAFVEGVFDLCGCHIAVGINLTCCRFDDEIDANHAQLDGVINLQGSYLANGLQAHQLRSSASLLFSNGFHAMDQVILRGSQIAGDIDCQGGGFEVDTTKHALALEGAHVKGHVFLSDGFKATGEVRLDGAKIGGNLDCNDGQFAVEQGQALSAIGVNVNGYVDMSGGFKATGLVNLLGAQIRGHLFCIEGTFEDKESVALLAHGVDVKGNVILGDGFKAAGAVALEGAKIGGNLYCNGGQFDVNQGDALAANGADIKGNAYLSDGFKATGRVNLQGAQIRGDLVCSGGQFEVEQGEALLADRLNIEGSIFLRNGFKAVGVVRLISAQIGGELACSGGQFEVNQGSALWMDGAAVGSDLKLDDGFKSTGDVRLVSAQIGCNLDCSGGQFEGLEGDALIADRANIKGEVFLIEGFKAKGKVRLSGAQIGSNLYCLGGQFDAQGDIALSLESAFVRGSWCLGNSPQSVCVNALNANVGVLSDDVAAWAPGSVLDGLRYASFSGQTPINGAERLEWLRRQSNEHLGDTDDGAGFRPQPWRQLQRVLRDMGHNEDAKQVGIAFQDRLLAIGKVGPWPKNMCSGGALLRSAVIRSWHYMFGKLAGYGYRPVDLVAWMFAVWLACGAAYWWLALPPQSAMAPSEPLVFQSKYSKNCQPDPDPLDVSKKQGNWYLCTDLPGEYSTFSPFAFSLDLLLPVVDLGQEKAWGAFIPTPKENPWEELVLHWSWGHAVRILTWFQTFFGWGCSLLLVAIVSGYSRRNDEGE